MCEENKGKEKVGIPLLMAYKKPLIYEGLDFMTTKGESLKPLVTLDTATLKNEKPSIRYK